MDGWRVALTVINITRGDPIHWTHSSKFRNTVTHHQARRCHVRHLHVIALADLCPTVHFEKLRAQIMPVVALSYYYSRFEVPRFLSINYYYLPAVYQQ